MKVTGKTTTLNVPNRDVFTRFCNCNNFGKFLPDQIKDWQSTEDYCQFSIPGIASLKVNIAEKVEFSKIVFAANNDKNIPINISLNMNGNDLQTDIFAEIEADIPIFLKPMVEKPLQNLVDMIADKLKTEN
ncbi:MAG: hypothetical protein MJZ72_05605 [Bacteroidales bacterium]|nr:hypothetical protein [Bacteroidales bacterium]